MELPQDDNPQPQAESLVDSAPLITAKQREDDFNRVFAWHGREISFTIASELYYRELRAHMNAPPLASYNTMGDFAAEAPRVLYCAHQSAQALRILRLLSPMQQLAAYDEWIQKNIGIHELDQAAKVANEIQEAITRARTQPADTEEIDSAGN